MSTPSTVQHIRSGNIEIVSRGMDPIRCLHSLHRGAAADLAVAETEADRRQATLLLDIARSGLDALGVTVASDTLRGQRVSKKVSVTSTTPSRPQVVIAWQQDDRAPVAFLARYDLSKAEHSRYERALRKSYCSDSYDGDGLTLASRIADAALLLRNLRAEGFDVVERGTRPAVPEERYVDHSCSQLTDDELDAALAQTRARY